MNLGVAVAESCGYEHSQEDMGKRNDIYLSLTLADLTEYADEKKATF